MKNRSNSTAMNCRRTATVLLTASLLAGCSRTEEPVLVDKQPVTTSSSSPQVPAPPVSDPSPAAGESAAAVLTAEAPQQPSGGRASAEAGAAAVRDAHPEGLLDNSAAQAPRLAASPSDVQPRLDELLAKLDMPPPWLEKVETSYDTSKPWKEARLEIRRLLGFGRTETHRAAIKLTWIYLRKGDIGDGHEYPMYTFLGGEPLWSIRAHEEFLAKPHETTPIHSLLTLASLYTQYGEFEKAKARLDDALNGLPGPPWRIMRKADVMDAYGDLYAAWGKTDEAKRNYAEAAALYPTAKPPFGGHLLPRRTAQVRSKLDLLTFAALETTRLRDGQYRDKALGYAGDIQVTVTVQQGKIADIGLEHEEKIDQNACVLIPQRIIAAQSLQVDGISGATVTKDAIVHGVYQCLKKAGL